MRRGVLGGTFDPIHIGHLILAMEAQTVLALDRVTFVPAGQPWRKADRAVSPPADRLAMVRLAIEGEPAFDGSPIEVEREGPSYTVETLTALAASGDELFLILGADAAADLPNWKAPEEIARLASVAVALRPGWDEAGVRRAVASVRGLGERLIFFPMPLIAVSGTELRARCRDGGSVRYYTPDAVARYIMEHALYPPGSIDEPASTPITPSGRGARRPAGWAATGTARDRSARRS